MKVGQNNQYLNQYAGLGAKPKGLSDKDAAYNFSSDIAGESGGKANEKISSSLLSHFTRVDFSVMPHVGLGAGIQATDKGLSIKNDDAIEPKDNSAAYEAKKEAMNGLMSRMGIKGQLTNVSIEKNYSTYFIETEGSEKNVFVIELENGEYIFAKTELDSKTLHHSLDLNRSFLGLNAGKLDIDEIKKAFARFFNVDELKDFIYEFWDIEEESEYKQRVSV